MIEVSCPCGAVLRVPDDNAGRTGQCRKCGTRLKITAPTIDVPPKRVEAEPAIAWSKPWYWIVPAAGGALVGGVVVGLLCLLMLGPSSSSEEAKSRPDVPQIDAASAVASHDTPKTPRDVVQFKKSAEPETPPATVHPQLDPANLQVELISATIGPITIRNLDDEDDTETAGRFLRLDFRITNNSKTHRIKYISWSQYKVVRESSGNVIDLGISVTDNFGNSYEQLAVPLNLEFEGQIKAEDMYPQTVLNDLLVIEPPVARFEYLIVELPGVPYGRSVPWTFKIDAKDVELAP